MLHHIKGCLEDTYLDNTILHHRTNDLKSNSTTEKITDKILNLAASVKTNENEVFISALVVINNKLNKKGTEVNKILMDKLGTRQLLFIDNKNFDLKMLNKSRLHLNEYGTTHLANKHY